MAIKAAPRARRILKVDRNQQFWLSKPRVPDEEISRPEFGQTVEAFSDLTAGANQMQVFPLVEPLAANTTLDFGGVAVVTTVAADKDDTIVRVVPGSAVAAFSKATTLGIEQIITLATDLVVGARAVEVNALAASVESNRPFKLNTSGVEFKTVRSANAGDTVLYIEPVTVGTTAVGTTVAVAGDTVSVEEYVLVNSANSVQRTGNAQILTDYVFSSGQDALKDVTTRDRSFAVSGLHVPGDFGLERVQQAILENEGAKIWFISSDAKGGFQWSANAVLGQDGDTTAVNQFKQVNFTVEVNGQLYRYDYPHLVNY